MSVFCKMLGHKVPRHRFVVASLGGLMQGATQHAAYVLGRGGVEGDGATYYVDTQTTVETWLLLCERCNTPLARVAITIEPVHQRHKVSA